MGAPHGTERAAGTTPRASFGGWVAPVAAQPVQRTRDFSSSNQCSTTTMLAGVAFGSAARLFEHQEPLAVRRHVIVTGGIGLRILGVEHLRRTPETNVGPDVRPAPRERNRLIQVEQLATAPRPRGARPAPGRDLPAVTVDLRNGRTWTSASGFIRLVREIATVGRDLGEVPVEQFLGEGSAAEGLASKLAGLGS